MKLAVVSAGVFVGVLVVVVATQAHGRKTHHCKPTHGESSIAVQLEPRLKVIQPAHTTEGC